MSRGPTVISLFTGAMGLDLGLERAGFEVRVALEYNPVAAATIRLNRPDVPLLEDSIEDVSTAKILRVARLRRREPTVVSGGPCCQAFSTVGQRSSMGDPRGRLFEQFLRVVHEAQPRFFVMENVRGVLSAAVRHRPLKERGPGYPPLRTDEELGSAFRLMLRELKKLGYFVVFGVVNAADYGVPQVRERVVFIGSRDGERVTVPAPTHVRESQGGRPPWVTLREALARVGTGNCTYHELCAGKRKFMRHVPEGGNWRNLPPAMQRRALGAAFRSWGGRVGFFRRLAWDRPAPALTTRPDCKATMLCHPSELRPLSIEEYAAIQTFPRGWRFAGSIRQQYVQVGNAVPVRLGQAVGAALRQTMKRRARDLDKLGEIECNDPEVLDRMANRPRTVLNPSRMRRFKTLEAAKRWLGTNKKRVGLLRYVTVRAREERAEVAVAR